MKRRKTKQALLHHLPVEAVVKVDPHLQVDQEVSRKRNAIKNLRKIYRTIDIHGIKEKRRRRVYFKLKEKGVHKSELVVLGKVVQEVNTVEEVNLRDMNDEEKGVAPAEVEEKVIGKEGAEIKEEGAETKEEEVTEGIAEGEAEREGKLAGGDVTVEAEGKRVEGDIGAEEKEKGRQLMNNC